MNTSAQTHQELAQLRRRVQIFYTAHTVLYAAALGLLVWRPARWAGLVLGVANMVFYFLWLRGQVKGYSNAVTAAPDPGWASAPVGGCGPDRQGALSGEEFDRWQILPRREGKGESLLTQNGFAGTLDGRKVAGTEVTLHYPYKNAQGRQDFSFLNGTLLWCEAPAQGRLGCCSIKACSMSWPRAHFWCRTATRQSRWRAPGWIRPSSAIPTTGTPPCGVSGPSAGKAGSGGQNAGSCAAVPGGNDVLPARPVLYRHHEGPRPAGGKDPDVEPSARAGRGVQLLPLAAEGKAGNGTVRKTKRRNMIQQYEMEPGIVQTIQWKRSGR